jgi:prepilin-type N-terminal cleavage/methylation domain-containing protein
VTGNTTGTVPGESRATRGRGGQAGLTLIELMIAVAIIGILASVAVFLYKRQVRRARASEVSAMFAEFHTRQEQYYIENNSYLATGANESARHPASPSGPDSPTTLSPLPPDWSSLRMSPAYTAVYCAYVARAGAAGAATGAIAQSLGVPASPTQDWYYLLAECDFDGDSTTNSIYLSTNLFEGLLVQNEGY